MKQSHTRRHVGKTQSAPREHREFIVVDEVHHISRNDRKKVLYLLYLQKLERGDSRKTELRLGYYTIGTKPGRLKDKWIWARYEVLLNPADLRMIVRKAEKKGWL